MELLANYHDVLNKELEDFYQKHKNIFTEELRRKHRNERLTNFYNLHAKVYAEERKYKQDIEEVRNEILTMMRENGLSKWKCCGITYMTYDDVWTVEFEKEMDDFLGEIDREVYLETTTLSQQPIVSSDFYNNLPVAFKRLIN